VEQQAPSAHHLEGVSQLEKPQIESQAQTRVRLTRKVVHDALERGPGERRRIWDSEISNLYLLITEAGHVGYYVRYSKLSGVKGDFAIGRASVLTPEEARESARSVLADLILNGVSPVERRKQRREEARRQRLQTFSAMVDQFWIDVSYKPGTVAGWKSSLRRHILPRLGKRPVAEVSSAEIRTVLVAIQADIAVRRRSCKKTADGRRQANICHDVIRRIFSHAIKLLEASWPNPAAFPHIFDERPQKRRALSDQRLAAIWRGLSAVEGTAEARAIGCKLHLLTLQRPCDIIRAKLSDFDWEKAEWRPRAEATKTGEEYFVPLSSESDRLFRRLFEISGSEWALPSEKNLQESAAENILRETFIAVRERLFADGDLDTNDIDLYDGRRFGRTLIRKRLKFDKEVAERVINHKRGGDLSNLYDVDDYADEIRAAQLAWSAEVIKIVDGCATAIAEGESR
jgi:integrase